jgi:hypothetical protein
VRSASGAATYWLKKSEVAGASICPGTALIIFVLRNAFALLEVSAVCAVLQYEFAAVASTKPVF